MNQVKTLKKINRNVLKTLTVFASILWISLVFITFAYGLMMAKYSKLTDQVVGNWKITSIFKITKNRDNKVTELISQRTTASKIVSLRDEQYHEVSWKSLNYNFSAQTSDSPIANNFNLLKSNQFYRNTSQSNSIKFTKFNSRNSDSKNTSSVSIGNLDSYLFMMDNYLIEESDLGNQNVLSSISDKDFNINVYDFSILKTFAEMEYQGSLIFNFKSLNQQFDKNISIQNQEQTRDYSQTSSLKISDSNLNFEIKHLLSDKYINAKSSSNSTTLNKNITITNSSLIRNYNLISEGFNLDLVSTNGNLLINTQSANIIFKTDNNSPTSKLIIDIYNLNLHSDNYPNGDYYNEHLHVEKDI